MSQKISFLSDGQSIEGLIGKSASQRGVVITHPHPLYGGNMLNPVVETISRAYREKGFTTLRFNFRGVGDSQGKYDHGHGEKRDVLAAVGYLKAMGLSDIHLAGYSFGAWVHAGVAAECENLGSIVMISPPLAFIDFMGIQPTADLRMIVVGKSDEISPIAAIREWLGDLMQHRTRVEMIEGADHFFTGRLSQLESTLLESLQEQTAV